MSLGSVDIVLLVLSVIVSLAIGIYHAIKGVQATPADYLLGGRMMGALPLAMSLTVGTISAITIMAQSGEMYTNGTQLWVMDVGIALGMYVVAEVLIPIFYPLHCVSLYHYIERRFRSKWLRKITVLLTLLGASIFLGFLLVPPSFFLQRFTKLRQEYNYIIMGLSCSLYSSFGGVKAVVHTDVVQSIIMIIGVLAILIQGSAEVGGLAAAWDIAYHRDRIEFFNFDFDPYQRHSFWLVIVYGFFFSLSTYGVNQNQTQRAFSASSVKEAKLVIYYSIVGGVLLRGLISLCGIVIFATFANCDPLSANGPPLTNFTAILDYVLNYLTRIQGLTGLFVASIYAAVFSSYSTQVNSITALLWEDFLKEIKNFKNWTETKVARMQKMIALIIGLMGIAMSFIVANISRSFFQALLKVNAAMWGPILGLFLVAVFLPWVKAKEATISFIVGIVVSIWIVLGQFLTQPPVAFLPLSREGCPPPPNTTIIPQTLANESVTWTTSSIEVTEAILTDGADSINVTENIESLDSSISGSIKKLNRGVGFYGISYCLDHCWGLLACIGLAIITIFITKPNSPEEVDEELIHPVAWKWFNKFHGRTKYCFNS